MVSADPLQAQCDDRPGGIPSRVPQLPDRFPATFAQTKRNERVHDVYYVGVSVSAVHGKVDGALVTINVAYCNGDEPRP